MSRSTLIRSLALVGAIGVAGTGLVACGSSSSTSTASNTAASTAAADTASTPASTVDTGTTASSTAAQAPAASTVDVVLGAPKAFSLVPSPTSATAGKVTFNVDNQGSMAHELVVIKTNTKAADLPTTKSGEAVETGNIGETGDMAAGTKKTLTVTLQKGHYVLLCNLPGHYAGGMYADFQVS